jgi:predicted DCC family thiol-disulfide oxidoreductase YuxK
VSAGDELVLLYDGLCGFCDGLVQFVLARDRRGTMKFAPLQGEFAREVLARHPDLRNIDSLLVVHGSGSNERVSAQSVAVADILLYLGGGWGLAGAVFRIVPRFISDTLYRAFAKTRYRIFGRYETCRIPLPAQRARFLD